jgi:Ca-activated chloride channel family protein
MTFARLDLLYYIVPCVVVIVLLRWRRRSHYLGHSRLQQMWTGFSRAGKLVYLPAGLQWLALAFLVLAALNPVLTFNEQQITLRGLDIVLVVDLSSSMSQALPVDSMEAAKLARIDPFFADFGTNPSRMDAVKLAVKTFIKQRQSDRIGMVVFSSNAYVVSPMTLDYPYLAGYVEMMDYRTLVGEGMTAIGEGIYTGIDLVIRQNEKLTKNSGDKLLVVLTDGENNYGRSAIDAARVATEKGFKIYLIGVDMPMSDLTNRLIRAVYDGGGAYYDVRNQEQLNDAYWEIGALEKGDFGVTEYQRSVPVFQHAVLASIACLALALGLWGLPYFTNLS